MKTIKKILGIVVISVIVSVLAGCTENFKEPPVAPVVTDEDIIADGYQIITIGALKKMFYDKHKNEVESFGKSITIGEVVGGGDVKYLAIKGRVISNDYFGNVYRSMYIQDYSDEVLDPDNHLQPEAIEVKLGLNSIETDYTPGSVVYIKLNGLVLGNYRYMLSLGSKSSSPDYANGYIDILTTVREHVLAGEKNRNLPPLDTLVVNKDTDFNTMFKNDSLYLGRLVRFEGVNSIYGTVEGDDNFSSSDVFPSFLMPTPHKPNQAYTNYTFEEAIAAWKAYDNNEVSTEPEYPRPGRFYPTYAFSGNGANAKFYGSTLLELGGKYFIARTSAYSSFANEALPFDYEITKDEKGNITDVKVVGPKKLESLTAIFTKYSTSRGGFMKYQLIVNNPLDVKHDRNTNFPSAPTWEKPKE